MNSAPSNTIAPLDSVVIDQIAAGEVVERPAAAIKELVENAFDASASYVHVDLEEGGLRKITVLDDGCGIPAAALELAVQRHTTSKIRVIADLKAVQTFGFRGEALAAIAAVARLTLESRCVGEAGGVRLVVQGGKIISRQRIGLPVGTRVTIESLFFNTPARRKFLRSPSTETAHIVHAVARTTLATAQGGAKVSVQGRTLLDIPSGSHFNERVRAALALRHRYVLHDIAYHDSLCTIHGVLSFGHRKKSEAKNLWFFVNQRFVRDRTLYRAVADVMRLLEQHTAALTLVAYLKIAGDWVDINVHPQKLEVRFSNPHDIYQAITAALLATCQPHQMMPTWQPPAPVAPNPPLQAMTLPLPPLASQSAKMWQWQHLLLLAEDDGISVIDWPRYWRAMLQWQWQRLPMAEHELAWVVAEPLTGVDHLALTCHQPLLTALGLKIALTTSAASAALLQAVPLSLLAMDLAILVQKLISHLQQCHQVAALPCQTALQQVLLQAEVAVANEQQLRRIRCLQQDTQIAGCWRASIAHLQQLTN